MPAVLAALTGAWSPLAALIAAVGILAITLCHAETASRFREPGGTYLYAREAFGPAVGFQMGWLSFWIRVTSMAANLNVFVDYLGQMAPAAGAGASAHRLDRGVEQVAGAALGLDEARMRRVGLDLAAQAQDLHVDRAVVDLGVVQS